MARVRVGVDDAGGILDGLEVEVTADIYEHVGDSGAIGIIARPNGIVI